MSLSLRHTHNVLRNDSHITVCKHNKFCKTWCESKWGRCFYSVLPSFVDYVVDHYTYQKGYLRRENSCNTLGNYVVYFANSSTNQPRALIKNDIWCKALNFDIYFFFSFLKVSTFRLTQKQNSFNHIVPMDYDNYISALIQNIYINLCNYSI